MIPLSQLLVFLVVTWIAWKGLKRLVFKHPLSILRGPAPESWWTGSLFKILNSNSWEYVKDVTDKYGSIFQFTAIFWDKGLFVYDSKALHHILVKDHHAFEEPAGFLVWHEVLLGKGLLSITGDYHRKQRKMLTPVFSVAHMREMVPTFYEVCEKLRSAIYKRASDGPKEIDMLSWMSRTALELIGQSGFGYSFDTLEGDSDEHPVGISLKKLLGTAGNGGLRIARLVFLPLCYKIGTPRFQRAVIDAIPWKTLHELRDIIDVLHNTSVSIFEDAKRSYESGDDVLAKRIGRGKDVMSILLTENLRADANDRLPDNELLAQISTMIHAGTQTTSNALARILLLLSEHPDVQNRLRQELQEAYAIHGSEMDYDTLTGLPYLDAVCRESLRLHPPAPTTVRLAAKDTILPLSKPIVTTEGKEVTEIFVPKGTGILISILSCNRNPDIWGPDALEWKPERWLSPLPSSVTEAHVPGVYSHQMTFLGGGRSCLGFKFSQLEMKVVLSLLIRSFKFAPTGKKIEWRIQTVAQPTMENSPMMARGQKKLELPLIVSLA